MTQNELYKELLASCLFGQNIRISDENIQCGLFRFQHVNHGIWKVIVEKNPSGQDRQIEAQIIPEPEWVEAILLDFYADELVRNWFPNAHMLEYHKKWSLGGNIIIENDGGVWTMTKDGEVIENGILFYCVTRLFGICEAQI